jgi:hypothetical protein
LSRRHDFAAPAPRKSVVVSLALRFAPCSFDRVAPLSFVGELRSVLRALATSCVAPSWRRCRRWRSSSPPLLRGFRGANRYVDGERRGTLCHLRHARWRRWRNRIELSPLFSPGLEALSALPTEQIDTAQAGGSSGRPRRRTRPVGGLMSRWTPWFWGIAYGHHYDRTPTLGCVTTREEAMTAFPTG